MTNDTNNACSRCHKETSPLICAYDAYYCPGCAGDAVPSAVDLLLKTVDMAQREPARAETWIKRASQPGPDSRHICCACKLNPPVQIRCKAHNGTRNYCPLCALEECPDVMTGLINKLGRN